MQCGRFRHSRCSETLATSHPHSCPFSSTARGVQTQSLEDRQQAAVTFPTVGPGPDVLSLSLSWSLTTRAPVSARLLCSVFVCSSKRESPLFPCSECQRAVKLGARVHGSRVKKNVPRVSPAVNPASPTRGRCLTHFRLLLPTPHLPRAPLGRCPQSPMPAWSSYSSSNQIPSRPLGSSLTSRRALPKDS